MNLKFLPVIAIATCLAGCTAADTEKSEGKAVAVAGDERLGQETYNEEFATTGVNDSAAAATRFIEHWATESLFYQEALEKLNKDELDVDKQVEAYRKSLINYIYETKLIDANLDTAVSWQEIETYYNEHLGNFILRENIVKVNYIKVPVKARDLEKIRRLLYSSNAKEQATLRSLCVQNAESFFMNDSTWLLTEDIKKEIPKLREEPEMSLVTGRVVEFSDSLYYYYLKVKDMKVKNGVSPINFESRNIRNFIINNRKIQLIRQYKQLLLEKAGSDKRFVRY